MFTQELVENSIKTTKRVVQEVLGNTFPIAGRINTLKALDVEIGTSKNLYNLAAQKEMKLNDKSLTVPVSVRLELVENSTGKTVDSDKITIIQLPVLTPRGSFIVDGTEYQATNQLRLRSGVYTRRQGDGNYETQVNLDAGLNNFKLSLDPKTKTFYLTKGTSNMFLYPVLIGLGVTHQALERYMGKELAEENRRQHGSKVEKELRKFGEQFKIDKPDIRKDVTERLFPSLKIDPTTTESTLGKGFSSVSTEMILTAVDKLRKVMLGDEPEDDRDSLEFKKFLSFDDHIEERIRNSAQKVVRKVNNRIDKATSVKELVSLGDFNTAVKAFFTTSSLSAPTEQTNPLSMFGDFSKVTISGEGGVESAHAVTNAMRDINPSSLGFLDPVHTPESENIGALLHLSIHAKKKGDTLATSVIDVKTGNLVEITPKELVSSCVAFPGQFDPATKKFKSDEVRAMQKKAVRTVKPSEVKYSIISPQVMFDLSTNMIPFLQNDQGNRAMMASKMQEQAIPLKHREAPLVQSELAADQTFEEMVGSTQVAKAPDDGVITNLKPLTIKTKSGKSLEVETYDNYPLANGSFIHHTLRDSIKVGVSVKKGDVLAESNFTKDGVLSIGTNMTVAFMPYKGFTFDDGIVVSESASKKFTSEHLYVEDFELTDEHVVDKDLFRKHAPTDANVSSLAKLNSKGVIEKGSIVEEGDFLVAALKRVEDTEEERMRRSLSRSLKRDWRNDSLVWSKSSKGEVIDVANFGKMYRITVKTEEPARQGDKIVGRHGNKGTISKVIPDGEMPETKNGQKIDVIINPMALPSRMNVGQLLESGASLVAKETGQTFKVQNFSGKDYLGEITKEMDRLGIKERQTVVDPDQGEIEEKIFVGSQYFLKLQHQTEKKFSARSTGGYTADEQPTRGSKNSGQALDALTNYTYLAHGAKENLREASVVKGQKNDEYWRAFRSGDVPPPPKVPFVFDKFINSIAAMGLKIDKSDDRFSISALTDKEVQDMSSGSIKDALLLKGADLKVEKGGLFDQTVTGGHGGGKWAHIDLVEPLPNPIFENAIRVLLDMSGKQYKAVLNGEAKLDGLTGGEALKKALSKIDVQKELTELKAFATSDNVRSIKRLDDAHKKIRYLNALEKTNKKPEDYILSKVPVLPPKFRPISAMEDGSLSVSDVNELYKHVVLLNTSLDMDKKSFLVDDKLRGKTREQLYNAIGSVYGLCDPITSDARSRKRRGIISQIGGESADGLAPKNAYFQNKIFRRRQDLSGRAVIAPGPELGIDEIGLPKEMAWKIYENHILRDMVKNKGFTAAQARAEVENKTRSAETSLMKVTSYTPVILNRAPSLHKFSTLAMLPKLIDGKTIELPSLLTRGFNADFDGDCSINSVVVRDGLVNLRDFPRAEFIETKGNVDLYSVPEGVEILTVWDGERRWLPVESFSVHRNVNMLEIETNTFRTLHCTDDHSLVTVDDELNYMRAKAEVGMTLPRICESVHKGQDLLENGSYTTTSRALAYEAVASAHSLGFTAGVKATTTPTGDECWIVTKHQPGNKYTPKLVSDRLEELHKAFGISSLVLTRDEAMGLFDLQPTFFEDPFWAKWKTMVLDESIEWEIITEIRDVPHITEAYDLTIPPVYTMVTESGFVIYDSMAVHVPVSEKARSEAMEKMLPSQNLFRPGFGTFMLAPVQEQILGLYFLTEKVNTSRPSKGNYGSTKDAIEAFRAYKGKDWRINDPITLQGKITTIGIAKFNNALPLRFRNYEMKRIDKKTLAEMFRKMQDDGASNIEMSQSATALKDLGNKYLYRRGFTVGLSDLKVDSKKKEAIFSNTEKKLGKNYTHEDFVKSFSQAEAELTEVLKQDNANNAFTHMALSGAKGNESNLRQILGAPGLLMDNMNRIVPVPVKRSYAEGLDTSEYWISLYGARKGMVDRQRSTSVPGALTKEVINNTIDHLVTLQDCGTTRGAQKDITDSYVHDRYLAQDVGTLAKKGQRLTQVLKREIQKAGISKVMVRSPLYCEAKSGVCSKCFGVMADGKPLSVGDNIGVIAGQAITEPTTQMTMNSFHTGGVASQEVGKEQGLPRVLQLLKMPENLPNSATLAERDGRVTNVLRSPAGGYEVAIDKEVHFVGVGITPTVKVGDTVKKGDKISTGVEKPQDVLRTRGLEETRHFLTKELSETYKGDIHHNVLETIVQKMTDLTKVEDPGQSTEVLPGEFVSFAKVEALNRQGADIKHSPTLRSIEHLPSYLNKDWIAKMNFRNIKKGIITAAQEAQESKYRNTENPITAFAYGVDFGKTPGKY